MLKKTKQIALTIGKYSGTFAALHATRWRRSRLLILAYHGMSLADEHEWDGGLFMPAEMFRQRLDIMKKSGCTVLPLDEAVQRLYAKDLPPKAIVITVDDGNHDFYRHAYPALQDANLPATVYLTTYYVNYNRPVFDAICAYLLWRGRHSAVNLQPLTGRAEIVHLNTEKARQAVWSALQDHAKGQKLSGAEKDVLAGALAREVKVDYEDLCGRKILHRMTPNEVREIAAQGVDIQLHTHRHRVPQDKTLLQQEINDNRLYIKELTGKEANHFCYPSGVYHTASLPWLREAGVISATTCDLGLASAASDSLLLPRFLDSSTLAPIEFESWLAGLSSFLPRR